MGHLLSATHQLWQTGTARRVKLTLGCVSTDNCLFTLRWRAQVPLGYPEQTLHYLPEICLQKQRDAACPLHYQLLSATDKSYKKNLHSSVGSPQQTHNGEVLVAEVKKETQIKHAEQDLQDEDSDL